MVVLVKSSIADAAGALVPTDILPVACADADTVA
jgi:hypothetical protein